MTPNRSSEERAMRDLIVPKLRAKWPSARIIHELPLRYSTNRIDLAAVTPTEIVSVEIKSSRDVTDRLEAQLLGFLPVSTVVIVAVAPKWVERLPAPPPEQKVDKSGRRYTVYEGAPPTEVERIIAEAERWGTLETWTVDAGTGTIAEVRPSYRPQRPWLARMLDMLHVAELVDIAGRHGVWQGNRPVHETLVRLCTEAMTGREIVAAVCAALRARSAFAAESDPPLTDTRNP